MGTTMKTIKICATYQFHEVTEDHAYIVTYIRCGLKPVGYADLVSYKTD